MKFIFSTPVLIRHLWQFKTVIFLHWYLICAVLFCWLGREKMVNHISVKIISNKICFLRKRLCRALRCLADYRPSRLKMRLPERADPWLLRCATPSRTCQHPSSPVQSRRTSHSINKTVPRQSG
jgi:hypothetical protein